ncbi:MAG: hypothetical protein P8010_20025 [Desulfosarcinaceae bacterium]
MSESLYWADNYIEKRCSPDEAIRFIKSGQRVFIGSACGQPQHLVKTLSARTNLFTGLEVVRMMSTEITPLSDIADKSQDLSLNIRQIYLGATGSPAFQKYKRFITPMNMSDVPSLFKSKKLPIDVALIQVSPPDDFGWMSLGVSVDVTMAAAQAARLVIAQVNPRMPRIMGQSFIHVNSVDVIVEHEEDLPPCRPSPRKTIWAFTASILPTTSCTCTRWASSPTASKASTMASWWLRPPSAPATSMNFCTTTPGSTSTPAITSTIPSSSPATTAWSP